MSKPNFPHTNQFRTLFGIGSSILFIFIGSLLITNAEKYDVNPILIKALGVITIVFFGGLLILFVKKLFSKSKQEP